MSKLFLFFFYLAPLELALPADNDFIKLAEITESSHYNSDIAEEGITPLLVYRINARLLTKEFDFIQRSFNDVQVRRTNSYLPIKNAEISPAVSNVDQVTSSLPISNNKSDKPNSDKPEAEDSAVFKYMSDKLSERVAAKSKDNSTGSLTTKGVQPIKSLGQGAINSQIKFTNQTVLSKIKLSLSKLSKKTIIIVAVILVIIVAALVYILFFSNPTRATGKKSKPQKNQSPSRESVEKVYAGGQTTLERGQTNFNRTKENYAKKPAGPNIEAGFGRGYTKTINKDDEYTRLLTFFELTDRASEDEIKKAYRDRVKSLHPDKKFDSPNTNSEEFMEIKQAYNRIMEIRSSWFGQK